MSEIVPVPAASLPIHAFTGQVPGDLRQAVGRAVDATGNESRTRQPGRRAGTTSCGPLPFPNTTCVTFPSRQIDTTAADSCGDNQVPRTALTAMHVLSVSGSRAGIVAGCLAGAVFGVNIAPRAALMGRRAASSAVPLLGLWKPFERRPIPGRRRRWAARYGSGSPRNAGQSVSSSRHRWMRSAEAHTRSASSTSPPCCKSKETRRRVSKRIFWHQTAKSSEQSRDS
jgi:hypothetical protein